MKNDFMKNAFVVKIEMGDQVICDNCNADFTNRNESGGFIMGSRGWCPDCAVETLKLFRQFKEEHLITAYCPANMSHKDWILSIR